MQYRQGSYSVQSHLLKLGGYLNPLVSRADRLGSNQTLVARVSTEMPYAVRGEATPCMPPRLAFAFVSTKHIPL